MEKKKSSTGRVGQIQTRQWWAHLTAALISACPIKSWKGGLEIWHQNQNFSDGRSSFRFWQFVFTFPKQFYKQNILYIYIYFLNSDIINKLKKIKKNIILIYLQIKNIKTVDSHKGTSNSKYSCSGDYLS
jgi:hypothetical protein